MSLNLYLSDDKKNAQINLIQTPTQITRECLAAGNTAGTLSKYIEFVMDSRNKNPDLKDELESAKKYASDKAWETVALTGIDYTLAYQQELQNIDKDFYLEHIDKVQDFLVQYPNATFSMI